MQPDDLKTFCNYYEYEDTRQMSPSSRESYEAELAWNAAIVRMRALVEAAHSSQIDDWFVTLCEELSLMDTGFRDER